MANSKGTCFVIMGFGKKTDFESGRTLDLDKSYRNLIKPAVLAAQFECVRADEIVHSGLIDVPMYDRLLAADIVIADLSTSNKNAFYELGIRHALRPYTTIVIAEDGMKVPFDVNHVVVRHYKHLGEDIGYDEAMRFRAVLTEAIGVIVAQAEGERVDSPVYRYLNGLEPPTMPPAPRTAGSRVAASPAASAPAGPVTHSALMKQVGEAFEKSDFVTAKSLLGAIRTLMKSDGPDRPDDPYVIQRLAFATYKSKYPDEKAALLDAQSLLAGLEPRSSNDTETLGLWGAVHKRLWELTRDRDVLDEAVRAHARGFYLRNDYYNGINLAFLLNVRAACATEPAEAITDFTLARRVRREVLAIAEQWVQDNAPAKRPPGQLTPRYTEAQYWVLATIGEALVGLGEAIADSPRLQEIYAAAPTPWMAESTRQQIHKLQALLADSPLKRLG